MSGRTYEAREVLRLLDVKPHVLRYWEQSLPLIRPRRNESGHRVWNAAQLRMLLRIRHLVVNRGMAVVAAGDAILHEAQPDHADTKARLEALRARLIALLLRNRARAAEAAEFGIAAGERPADNGDAPPVAGATGAGDAGHHTGDPGAGGDDAELPWAYRLRGAPLQLATILPTSPGVRRSADHSRLLTPTAAGTGVGQGAGTNAATAAVPAAAPATAGDSPPVVAVPVSHLFADVAPERAARVLLRLIRRRASGQPAAPTVIPVPSGAEAVFRTVVEAECPGIDTFFLEVPPVAAAGVRWWSPRLSLLVALAVNHDLDGWLGARGAAAVYLWAPDDPVVPLSVPAEWVRAAAAADTGLVIGVQVRRGAIRLPDATVVNLERWRPAVTEVLAGGRWRFAAAGPGSLCLERPLRDADAWNGGWRYDVWQQDLAPAAVRMPLDGSAAPAPWRGAVWCDEVARVWPGIDDGGDRGHT